MKLVVGLGNPGKKYERTRHNAGHWWAQQLAASLKADLRSEPKFQGWAAVVGDARILLPATFMNESGRAVAALATFYKIEPREIIVVHDELDLAPGVARMKFGGGSSGHNGLKSIIDCLGSNEFWRLRIGIGHPRESALSEQIVADYVLHPPRAEESELIDQAIERSLAVWPLIAAGDTQGAMLKLHTKDPK
jgi:PTH1 family peptidyl-tRNA hydrolase